MERCVKGLQIILLPLCCQMLSFWKIRRKPMIGFKLVFFQQPSQISLRSRKLLLMLGPFVRSRVVLSTKLIITLIRIIRNSKFLTTSQDNYNRKALALKIFGNIVPNTNRRSCKVMQVLKNRDRPLWIPRQTRSQKQDGKMTNWT